MPPCSFLENTSINCKKFKIDLDIQHPALDDNCSARLVNVDVTVTAPYSHFHLTSAKWRQVFAVDRLTCRVSKYRIQLFSPVRILCCLTALLRASYDLRAIWKHSNHRLPNRVSHHLHLVKGLVFQSSFLQLLRKDASQQVTGTSNRRGRAKRQRTISLDSIRMIQMHICIIYMYLLCIYLHCDYLPALARLAARTGLKAAGKKAHLRCSTPLRHGRSILRNYNRRHRQDLSGLRWFKNHRR